MADMFRIVLYIIIPALTCDPRKRTVHPCKPRQQRVPPHPEQLRDCCGSAPCIFLLAPVDTPRALEITRIPKLTLYGIHALSSKHTT